ncbi:hypothetical protein HMPREF3293_02726 [Christensenella minuta]|uniref:Uncharacterized protein n=1 Tax=Christensenella minuta TaxID=626937 RepID=A0A136Q2B5_9FIRM|nr:hypothetical protein HMPREF3293_02726 [Christensenella minuta]
MEAKRERQVIHKCEKRAAMRKTACQEGKAKKMKKTIFFCGTVIFMHRNE